VVRVKCLMLPVDIRKGSPDATGPKWAGAKYLSEENKCPVFWVPTWSGLHGYCCIVRYTDLNTKCTDYYDPAMRVGLIVNDPLVGIEWPRRGLNAILSAKDQVGQTFKQSWVLNAVFY